MDGLCYLCLAGPAQTRVPAYDVNVCSQCWVAAESGWPEHREPALFDALGRRGLLIPDRNERGRLPRDYSPPADFSL